jgi:hypothetical protein
MVLAAIPYSLGYPVGGATPFSTMIYRMIKVAKFWGRSDGGNLVFLGSFLARFGWCFTMGKSEKLSEKTNHPLPTSTIGG